MFWLHGVLGRGAATGLGDCRPRVTGVRDQTVVAGLLPDGAAAAAVVGRDGVRCPAECADGAWIAVLPEPGPGELPAVKFMSSDGRIIRPSLPAGWRSEPVPDAQEPCPACEAVDWDQVWPTDQSRGGSEGPDGEFVPTPLVVCRVCGHEESVGGPTVSAMVREGPLSPEDAERIQRLREERLRYTREVLDNVDFAVYSVAGWVPRFGHCQGTAGRNLSVELVHERGPVDPDGLVTIVSACDPEQRVSERELAREALSEVVGYDETCPERSRAGRALWRSARARKHEQVLSGAETGTAEVRVDGAATRFTTLQADGWAIATRVLDEQQVIITTRGVSPTELDLVSVDDLSGLIADS
jgi:hypothetical protein